MQNQQSAKDFMMKKKDIRCQTKNEFDKNGVHVRRATTTKLIYQIVPHRQNCELNNKTITHHPIRIMSSFAFFYWKIN